MKSRMTARPLTWFQQNGGAHPLKRELRESTGLRKKMSSVSNMLNQRDLWEIEVVSSRQ